MNVGLASPSARTIASTRQAASLVAAPTTWCWAQTGAPAQRSPRSLQPVPASLAWQVIGGGVGHREGQAGGWARAVVRLSFVPVREAEQDECALRREIGELRGRLERLEQVSWGAWGKAGWAGHAPS